MSDGRCARRREEHRGDGKAEALCPLSTSTFMTTNQQPVCLGCSPESCSPFQPWLCHNTDQIPVAVKGIAIEFQLRKRGALPQHLRQASRPIMPDDTVFRVEHCSRNSARLLAPGSKMRLLFKVNVASEGQCCSTLARPLAPSSRMPLSARFNVAREGHCSSKFYTLRNSPPSKEVLRLLSRFNVTSEAHVPGSSCPGSKTWTSPKSMRLLSPRCSISSDTHCPSSFGRFIPAAGPIALSLRLSQKREEHFTSASARLVAPSALISFSARISVWRDEHCTSPRARLVSTAARIPLLLRHNDTSDEHCSSAPPRLVAPSSPISQPLKSRC